MSIKAMQVKCAGELEKFLDETKDVKVFMLDAQLVKMIPTKNDYEKLI